MHFSPNGILPLARLARLDNFGHSLTSAAYLFRPSTIEQLAEIFTAAGNHGVPVTLRGSGRSYGDASLNAGRIVVDIRRMNRILEWDPETGVVTCEPGVTIEQLWKHILEDGWWPPVVPGTMFPTLGGCLGMNIHGKNNWQKGTLGEHVTALTLLTPGGEERNLNPADPLFQAVIGGLGMLGAIVRVTMRMKRVYSGMVNVRAWAEADLTGMLDATDAGKDAHDYIVGWIDCTRGGRRLGRGQMHSADNLPEGADPFPNQTLCVDHQVLPDTFFGVIPRSILYRFMRPAMNNLGVRAVNSAKYLANRTVGNDRQFWQSHVAFNFLLDYIPNWERAYGRGGLIQYQCFIPKEAAHDAFSEIIRRGLKHRLPSYLGVLKRHRPDNFLLSHAVDGFSLAQDYRVTRNNRAGLEKLLRELDEIVVDAGGKFYFAKDSTLRTETVRRYLGEKTIVEFRRLKKELDPGDLLESDLYRRCFEPLS